MIVGVHGFASPFWNSILMTPRWAWSLPVPFPWHVHLRGLHGLDLLQARAVSWLCVAVPVTYAFLLWRAVRSRAELDGAEWLSVAASAAGVGFLVHAFYTADFFHIAQGVVPFVIAAGAFSAHLWRTTSRRWSVAVLFGLAFLVFACWLLDGTPGPASAVPKRQAKRLRASSNSESTVGCSKLTRRKPN